MGSRAFHAAAELLLRQSVIKQYARIRARHSGGDSLRQFPCSLGHTAVTLAVFVGPRPRTGRVALDAPPPDAGGDRGQPEHRKDHEDVERVWKLHTSLSAVAVEEGLLVGNSSVSEIFTDDTASAAGSARHVIRDAEIPEVRQRIADRRQLPVQYCH